MASQVRLGGSSSGKGRVGKGGSEKVMGSGKGKGKGIGGGLNGNRGKGRVGKGGSEKVRGSGEGKGSGGGLNGDGGKGRKSIKIKGCAQGERCVVDEEDAGSDGESYVEGFYEAREISKKLTYERKARSCSQGDYGKKPEPNVKPTVHFTSKTSILEPRMKRTLAYIGKETWDEKTANDKGPGREAYYDRCIKIFKDYYKYPEGWTTEAGDGVVRAHLHRNFKSWLNKEKERLDEKVLSLREVGYTDDEIDWSWYKPHYFSARVWASILEYWRLPAIPKWSKNGQEARKKMEFTSRTGAIPYIQRREEADAEREARGELPLTEEEFMELVYNPTDPAVINLKAKMNEVRASQPEESSHEIPCDDTPTPQTIKDIHQKKNLLVLLETRPPKKGKSILYPHQTVSELVGIQAATKVYGGSQKMEYSHPGVGVPDEIYMMMSNILDEVRQMVISLPMHEVTQSLLDEKVRNLATAAFTDPGQSSLRTHYIRTATSLLRQILKDNDKVIVEEAQLKKSAPVVDIDHTEGEDEDVEAYRFPLGEST